jgi:hypothetical protein
VAPPVEGERHAVVERGHGTSRLESSRSPSDAKEAVIALTSLDLKTIAFLPELLHHSGAIVGLAQLTVKLRQAVGTTPRDADVTIVIVHFFRFRMLAHMVFTSA